MCVEEDEQFVAMDFDGRAVVARLHRDEAVRHRAMTPDNLGQGRAAHADGVRCQPIEVGPQLMPREIRAAGHGIPTIR